LDPITASINQTQAVTQSQIGIGVLRKSLDMAAEEGAQLVKMMAQSSGVGGRVDIQA
jgi:hypothetical protein